jgi:hypothetical protein
MGLVTIVLLTIVEQRPLLAAAGGGAVEGVGGKVTDPVWAWETWWRATDGSGSADEGEDQDA